MLNKKEQKRRRKELNEKKFPSEMWFEKLLKLNEIGNYSRNLCLIYRYFGDFVWESHKIVVEIDGKSHQGKEDYDNKRDALLTKAGYLVCRIRHFDSDRALAVIERLKIALKIPGKTIPHRISKKRMKLLEDHHKKLEAKRTRKMKKAASYGFKGFARKSQEQGLAKTWLENKKNKGNTCQNSTVPNTKQMKTT